MNVLLAFLVTIALVVYLTTIPGSHNEQLAILCSRFAESQHVEWKIKNGECTFLIKGQEALARNWFVK